MSEKVARLSRTLTQILVRHVRPLFVVGVKLTIIARYPGCDESDVLVTDDSIDELIKLLERSRNRPELGVAQEGKT